MLTTHPRRPGGPHSRTWACLLLALTNGACAGTTQLGEPTSPERVHEAVVENWTTWDLRVYVESSGIRHTLGHLGSQQRRRFDITRFVGAATGYRLGAHPVGTRAVLWSDPVLADPGRIAHWSLSAQGQIRALTMLSRQ